MLIGLPDTTIPILRCKGTRLFDGGTPASLFAGKKLEIRQSEYLATCPTYQLTIVYRGDVTSYPSVL